MFYKRILTSQELLRRDSALFPGKTRPVPVAFSGGMLREGSPVRHRLLAIVETHSSDLRFADVRVDPPIGALAMAARTLYA